MNDFFFIYKKVEEIKENALHLCITSIYSARNNWKCNSYKTKLFYAWEAYAYVVIRKLLGLLQKNSCMFLKDNFLLFMIFDKNDM